MFPKVPQSSQTESLGFPRNTPSWTPPLKNPIIFVLRRFLVCFCSVLKDLVGFSLYTWLPQILFPAFSENKENPHHQHFSILSLPIRQTTKNHWIYQCTWFFKNISNIPKKNPQSWNPLHLLGKGKLHKCIPSYLESFFLMESWTATRQIMGI